MLEEFLRQEGVSDLLNFTDPKSKITKSTRTKLIRQAGEYTKRRFGMKPKRQQKIAIARAVVELFPVFKTNDPTKSEYVN